MTMPTKPRRRRSTVLTALALATALTGTISACEDSTTTAETPAPAKSSQPPTTPAAAGPSLHMVTNNGRKLAFHVTPGHLPAIVLDAGGGLDSSHWKKIAGLLAEQTGSKIITYDRAGMGKSDETAGPWNAVNAAADLKAGLTELGVTRDAILVSHSQAGEVATYFTKKNPDLVSGAVLVDANLPNFFTERVIAGVTAANKAKVGELKGKPSTREVRQLLATAANYGPMHRAYHKVSWPKSVPATVIVSSKTPFETPNEAQLWRNAQAQFAKAASNRELVVADGSSHDIPTDRPDVIVNAVKTMTKARS